MSSDLISGASGDAVRLSGRHNSFAAKPGTAAGRQGLPQSGPRVSSSPDDSAVIDMQALSSAVSTLKDYVQNIQRDLEFSVDKELNRVIIRVYDSETQEVIRQIPAEEMLKLARQLARAEEGLLLDAKA